MEYIKNEINKKSALTNLHEAGVIDIARMWIYVFAHVHVYVNVCMFVICTYMRVCVCKYVCV